MRLLVVEDNRTNLLVLKGILQNMEECEVEGFLDPVEALARVRDTAFDLILVDYMMPRLDGRQFILEVRQIDAYRHIPIVMITADGARQTRIASITAGATDFLNKPVDPVELRARIGNLLTLRRQQREIEQQNERLAAEVEKATRHLVQQEEEIVARLSMALAYRDDDTGLHTSRVAAVARMIAEELGLPPNIVRMIFLASPLHDVGKVAIPDQILLKPGRLTPAEIEVMRAHVPVGESILSDASSELVRTAWRIASAHHERWDGQGYPRGRAGEEIAIEARIASVADVFDALCSSRPYKPAWEPERARQLLQEGAGTQFDPACIAAFERRWPEIVDLYRGNAAHPEGARTDVAQTA